MSQKLLKNVIIISALFSGVAYAENGHDCSHFSQGACHLMLTMAGGTQEKVHNIEITQNCYGNDKDFHNRQIITMTNAESPKEITLPRCRKTNIPNDYGQWRLLQGYSVEDADSGQSYGTVNLGAKKYSDNNFSNGNYQPMYINFDNQPHPNFWLEHAYTQ